MRWFSPKLVLICVWTVAGVADAAGPADAILKLVPPDAGLTLAVEDLRGQARRIGVTALFQGILKLPASRAWLASDRFRNLERAGQDVEAALGVPIAEVRDRLLGDAFVLTLKPGPVGRPDQARGLLLARPGDRALLDRLIAKLNAAQAGSGELIGTASRPRGGLTYTVRKFKPGGRPTEYFIVFDDSTFAWSNSEELLQGVIDRKLGGGAGLDDNPAFLQVRRGLPEHPLASLFLDPRLVEQAINAAPRPAKPADERSAAILSRYVAAVGYAGAAIEWRDGFMIHTHEAIAPEKLDPWLRRWMTRPSSPVELPGLVPGSAIAVLSAHLDFEAVRDAFLELVPEDDRPAMENLKLGLQGLFLGHDPNTEVLPRLGPGTLAYIDAGPRFPIVGVVDWSDQPGMDDLATPLDNAMRTGCAFYALDPARRAAHLRVENRVIGGKKLTSLTDGARPRLTYRVDRNRLVVGNAPEAVARFATGPPPRLLAEVRTKYFPEAETFAVVDLQRLAQEVRKLRGPITRRLASRSGRAVEEVDRDLGQLLALADLLRAATFSSIAGRGATEVHRTIGLIAR